LAPVTVCSPSQVEPLTHCWVATSHVFGETQSASLAQVVLQAVAPQA
jgi:hypothetical protein